MSWWQTPAGQKRLERDRALLAPRHPGLSLGIVGNHVEARGSIVIEVGDAEIGLRYAVVLVFPDDYPESPPVAYDAGNGFAYEADRHFFPDGRCCLWLDVAPQWSSLDQNGLIRLIDEHLAVFYVRQWLYDSGNGWVGPAYPHGPTAYLEYAMEQGLSFEQLRRLVPAIRGWDEGARACPCGSGKAYWVCHREFALSFRRANPETIRLFLMAIARPGDHLVPAAAGGNGDGALECRGRGRATRDRRDGVLGGPGDSIATGTFGAVTVESSETALRHWVAPCSAH